MAKRPHPSLTALWQRHEELYCGIFLAALRGLSNKKLTGNENSISLALYPIAESLEEHEIPLHVECKLLGRPKPSSPSWKFNENYVVNGIKRFDSKTHEYGKRALSGIMIGYIISMEPKTILDEVNYFPKKELPDNPCIKFTFEKGKTFQSWLFVYSCG